MILHVDAWKTKAARRRDKKKRGKRDTN